MIKSMPVPMDLGEAAVADALQMLSYEYPRLVVGGHDMMLALRLAARYPVFVEVNDDLPMDAWYMRIGGNVVFSPGADNDESKTLGAIKI